MPHFVLFLILSAALSAAEPAADTANLSVSLKRVRGDPMMTPTAFRQLQREYLQWIDRRVSKGVPLEEINRDVRRITNHVDPKAYWANASDAGVLEDLKEHKVRGADDLLAIVARIGVGASCSVDDTVILYERASLRRIGWVNGHSKGDGHFYLTGVAANKTAPGEARIVATGWDTSNCTSTWNGKAIRIHQSTADGMMSLLESSVGAWTGDRPETVAPYVEQRGLFLVRRRYLVPRRTHRTCNLEVPNCKRAHDSGGPSRTDRCRIYSGVAQLAGR